MKFHWITTLVAVCLTAAITLIFSQKLLGITNLQQETLDNLDNGFIEVEVPYQIEQGNEGDTREDSFGLRTKDHYPEIKSSEKPENITEIGAFISADRVEGMLSQSMELEPQHLGEFIPVAPPE